MIQAFPGDTNQNIIFAPIITFLLLFVFSVVMINPRVCFLVFTLHFISHYFLVFLDERLFFLKFKTNLNGFIYFIKKYERKYFVQSYSNVAKKLFLAVHHV